MSLSSISQTVLELPMQERAALIDQLFDSIDAELNTEERATNEAKWAAESERRVDAVDAGEMKTIDGATAIANLRRSIPK
jgi:putative addiction module component (TIGR02574 family)